MTIDRLFLSFAAVLHALTTAKVSIADLIVLDRNIFDIDPHDIHRAQVQLTMMNGRVMHEV